MKVLIVDDEKTVRKGIVSILQQAFPDMQTIAEASNGEEAMKTVKTLLPDIVITDVKMPVIDGMELTKMIHTFDAEIKVIVLSSYDDYTYVRQCMKHGAIDYLLKPIDKHEFLSLINLLRVNENASMCIAATDPNELINDAKNYIRKHYSDDISLTKVAEYVHLNPSYFSNLRSARPSLPCLEQNVACQNLLRPLALPRRQHAAFVLPAHVSACLPFRRPECPTLCRRCRCCECRHRQVLCCLAPELVRWPHLLTVPATLLRFQWSY